MVPVMPLSESASATIASSGSATAATLAVVFTRRVPAGPSATRSPAATSPRASTNAITSPRIPAARKRNPSPVRSDTDEAVGGEGVARDHDQDRRDRADEAHRHGRGQAQPLGPDADHQRERRGEAEQPPARVGERDRGEQRHQRQRPRHPQPRAATEVGPGPRGHGHRHHAHQRQRVPVVQRRPQAGEALGVVEVDQARDVEPGEQLAAEGVERDRGGDRQVSERDPLRGARQARAERDAERRHQRVGDRPVELQPALVRRDRPGDRQRAPPGERAQQPYAEQRAARGRESKPAPEQQPGERAEGHGGDDQLEAALLRDTDRAAGKRRVQARHDQGGAERGGAGGHVAEAGAQARGRARAGGGGGHRRGL